ncbi:CobW family GTP-binding protein [Methanococcus voltae]|uniref:G3E family GTPase n=2 Tax=Methanococcus voltae TaxID=2188 RepID=Q6V6W5_METVO|nr:GTP-binding protein [Methanococcus voltae]AAQ55475.1 low-affinity zinc transport protein-like protein [Methanococcus voltae PS]MBP2172849.1 G3E family GTPase [Methanococcus voltae]MBP2201741.1 G3E family GTPase [Methanococcus voltae]MCS3922529.1 G3E family GTPase [Methanococcus voltae PS]
MNKIKIDVISGYLGCGKTTFIQKLIKATENERIVIIENEFGDIGIDGDILRDKGLDVVELEKGCICCTLKLNFLKSLKDIVEYMKPTRIIVEPTGMALLSQILGIVLDENNKEIQDNCKLNSVITVVDGENYLDQVELFGDFFNDQIRNADKLIISKSQYITQNELDNIVNSLKELNDNAILISENWDSIDSDKFLKIIDDNKETISKELYIGDVHKAMQGVSSVLVNFNNPLNVEAFKNAVESLKSNNYGLIMRGKGYINYMDDKNPEVRRYAEFNYVGNNYELENLNTKKSSEICIIGKDLKEKEILDLFKF